MGEEVLQVQMLGGFSVTWNGISIAGGPKQRESQFVYLLQLLLHRLLLLQQRLLLQIRQTLLHKPLLNHLILILSCL